MYMYVYDSNDAWAARHTRGRNSQSEDRTASEQDGPPPSPVRKALVKLRGMLAYWYLLWELYMGTYMFEPVEKVIVNAVLVSIFGLILAAAVTYLQGHVITVFQLLISSGDT